MEHPDNISFMMSFLKDFNYPLIHSMSYEEMANVFHISNRCFLVCWALKLLDEECYLEVLKDREHDKELLGNLVHHHGFCTGNEKMGLFNGDLPIVEQVQILHGMFKFIIELKKVDSTESRGLIENRASVSLENLQTLINTNLNIFPTLGEIKTLSGKDKLLQIGILRKEIKELQLSSENNCLEDKGDAKRYICQINKSELQDNVEKLCENFYNFDRVIKTISKEKSYELRSDYKVDPKSEELLINCNKYLKIISQFIEDLRTINTLAIEDPHEPEDEIWPLIQILAEQLHTGFRSL